MDLDLISNAGSAPAGTFALIPLTIDFEFVVRQAVIVWLDAGNDRLDLGRRVGQSPMPRPIKTRTSYAHPKNVKPTKNPRHHVEKGFILRESGSNNDLKLAVVGIARCENECGQLRGGRTRSDRKSTRLNSSHTDISRMPSSA